jgi:NitT/TauT family transport system substrate-binding protein
MKFRSIGALTSSALAVMALAGCASGSSSSSTSTSSNSTSANGSMTINLGIGPVADFGQYYVAAKEGYFAQNGLTVHTTNVASGPEGISAIKSGQLDITYSATLPLYLADQSGLGLKLIGPGDIESPGHWQYYMLVGPNSSIKTLSQAFAKGTKIGWIGSSTPNAIAVKLLMNQLHIPSGNVTFVTLPVPDITTALKNGEVDAAIPLEPFTTTAIQSKIGHTVGVPLDEVMGNSVPTGGYIASPSWISSHQAEVSAFNKALAEATTFIEDNPSQADSIIGQALHTSASVAKAEPPIDFVSTLSQSDVQTQIQQARQVGLLSSATLTASEIFAS